MNRRDLLKQSAALSITTAIPFSGLHAVQTPNAPMSDMAKLNPPAEGTIPVAFVLSDGAVVIDFCGPWEVFQDVHIPDRKDHMPFHLYTVAETTSPIEASGGMKVLPSYTFETAPAPKVIVIPAQRKPSEAMLAWIRKSAKAADITMSVCTGAFVLARTGLLAGKSATTHHSAYRQLAMEYPDINVKRGARFVENGNLATAGGLSSGIDLALRVVERYFGTQVAKDTAYQMEYQGQGWTNPNSNEEYEQVRVSTDAHPVCPVCEMDVDVATAPKAVYKGKTYYFCSTDHKQLFDATPEKYIEAAKN
ncbi:DJ-1/PfpI family protein [Alloacidobacterium sp.]|uniref:DJ-1/PfpI family protein n=1 Tax=Alloacidobacterium sp. TaxID=2951999 RepID=UPI002D70B1E2|nr:DJ-1/PfpI family protein [Alloacidobacterium sp.]HYK34791.1 DJ-1/PfpI family protein [Alloacidobacterium sp.]